MGKHQFSALIQCGGCGNMVGMVEAFSWREAAEGRGLCAECSKHAVAAAPRGGIVTSSKQQAEPAPEPEQPVEPVYAGQAYDATVLAEVVPEVVVEVVEPEMPRRPRRKREAQ